MRKQWISFLFCLISFSALSQSAVYMTRNGQVSFFSRTPMENIDGVNNEVTSIINTETGEVVFAILIKSFRFEKALMEEHFNENYMESSKIPKSTFQGKISNLATIDFAKDGSYPAMVEGDLTIHGVKQHIKSEGTIVISKGKPTITSSLSVKLADYKIERPALVAEKISETINIKINCQYNPKS